MSVDSPLLELRNITKRFPGVVALKSVDLVVERGDVHVLLGENGAGKSSLVKLLAGMQQADEGELFFEGAPYQPRTPLDAFRRGIRVVHQELNLMPNLSVAENLLFEHLPRHNGFVDYPALYRRASALLAEVGLDLAPQTRVDRLGIAQMQLVEIARALCYESKLLVLDEPTATLTPREIARLFGIIKQLQAKGVTFIYISHRLNEIYEIGNRVTVLRNGQHVATRPIAELSLNEIVQMMVGRAIHEEHAFHPEVALGAEILRVTGLQRTAHDPAVSFMLRSGEILGIAGLVGSGRTENMRAIFGADRRVAGQIAVDGTPVEIRTPHDAVRHGLGLLTEDRKHQGLLLDLPLAINITLTDLNKISRFGLLRSETEAREATALVQSVQIKTPSLRQIPRNLSGGNQQKVVIAKWLFRGSRVLIFDEPTRGIDVGARREIYELLWTLAAQGKGLIVVSSDLSELLSICHRMLVFSKGTIVGELERADFDQERILALAYQEYLRP
ncbi:MAG: sugar ABC transporter ATP-binding protein [Herpetosiphonaceae bacterium]|nr:sugar ABC transporter ATP-binding protein [Herpetosiphonaceae bacterium]